MTGHPMLAYADDVDFGDGPERRTQWSPNRLREDNARLRRLVIDICRDLGARLDESPSRAALRVMGELDKATRRLETVERRLKEEVARRELAVHRVRADAERQRDRLRAKDKQQIENMRIEITRLHVVIARLRAGT